MVGTKSRQNMPKTGKELDFPSLTVTERVNDRFAAAIYYRIYRLLKKLSRYDDDVAHTFTQDGEEGRSADEKPRLSQCWESPFRNNTSQDVMHEDFKRAWLCGCLNNTQQARQRRP